jgi:hypothetical protein
VSYGVRFEGGALVQLNGLPADAFDALLERVVVLVDEPGDAAVIPPGVDQLITNLLAHIDSAVPATAYVLDLDGTGW